MADVYNILITRCNEVMEMASGQYYEAKKYAFSLDYSHGRYESYHQALLMNLYSEAVERAIFMKLAKEAHIDLAQPDETSTYPHPIHWWNVDLSDYVLLAKDGEQENYWAFTRRGDEIMQRLAKAFDEEANTATSK